MLHDSARMAHILIGSVAVALFWGALLAVKGGPRHRLAGRAFFLLLLLVALSVGPLLFLPRPGSPPGAPDPARIVQFTYLVLCLATVTRLSWTAIRWKADLARFRSGLFRVSAAVILLLGLVVLVAGLIEGNALTVTFSLVGLTYGSAMLRFAFLRRVHPRWWLIWHLNGVCGLLNAVHGTLLALLWRWMVAPDSGEMVAVAMQMATLAAGLALRLWFGQSRGAPLRLTPAPSKTAAFPA